MKNVWLAFLASLMLAMPSRVAAGHHEIGHLPLPVGHMWKHGALDEQKWMEMVQTYTPEQAGEWKKVLDERNALREQFKDEKSKTGDEREVQADEKRTGGKAGPAHRSARGQKNYERAV